MRTCVDNKEETTMLSNLLRLAGSGMLASVMGLAQAQTDGIYYAAHHDYRVVEVADGL